jgi:hypothetical protein
MLPVGLTRETALCWALFCAVPLVLITLIRECARNRRERQWLRTVAEICARHPGHRIRAVGGRRPSIEWWSGVPPAVVTHRVVGRRGRPGRHATHGSAVGSRRPRRLPWRTRGRAIS